MCIWYALLVMMNHKILAYDEDVQRLLSMARQHSNVEAMLQS